MKRDNIVFVYCSNVTTIKVLMLFKHLLERGFLKGVKYAGVITRLKLLARIQKENRPRSLNLPDKELTFKS